MRKSIAVVSLLVLALVLLLGAAPGVFAGPTTPTAGNDPFVRAANYFKTHQAPEAALQVPAGMQVIATGLNNGRGITIGPDGGTYLWVPPGEFMMGSEEGSGNEKPVHRVRIMPRRRKTCFRRCCKVATPNW